MPEQRSSGEGNGIIRRILLKLGMAGADDQPRAQHDSELTEIVADQGSTQATTILRRSSSSPNFGSTDQAPSLIARDSVPIEAALLLVHLQKSSVQVKSQDGLTILSFLIDTLTSSSVELFRIDNDQRILLESKTISFPEISIPIDLKIDEIDPFSQTFEIHLNASVHPSKLIKGGRFTASQEITTLQITPEDAEAVRVTGQTIRVGANMMQLGLLEIYGQPISKSLVTKRDAGYFLSQTTTILSESDGGSVMRGFGEDSIIWVNRECVICLSQTRDTLFLPCRHMCLCAECAESIVLSSDKCPICRQEYTAILNITIAAPSFAQKNVCFN